MLHIAIAIIVTGLFVAGSVLAYELVVAYARKIINIADADARTAQTDYLVMGLFGSSYLIYLIFLVITDIPFGLALFYSALALMVEIIGATGWTVHKLRQQFERYVAEQDAVMAEQETTDAYLTTLLEALLTDPALRQVVIGTLRTKTLAGNRLRGFSSDLVDGLIYEADRQEQ